MFSSAVKLSLRDPEGVLQQARAVGELGVQDEVLQVRVFAAAWWWLGWR